MGSNVFKITTVSAQNYFNRLVEQSQELCIGSKELGVALKGVQDDYGHCTKIFYYKVG